MHSHRSKYNCILEELDTMEVVELEKRIKNFGFHPWLSKFIERFHHLAHSHKFSKADISEFYSSLNPQKQLLRNDYKLNASTLTENTKPTSKNLRAPNVDTLIALSECFNVSLDYLVGKTDCMKPQFEKVYETTGLKEDSILLLGKNLRILEVPSYNCFSDTAIITDKGLSDSFPQALPNNLFEKYYYKEHNSDDESTKSDKDIIREINTIMAEFPEIFNSDDKINETDKPETISKKINEFNFHCPTKHFFETLNLLITYKDGYIIKLLSDYLYYQETYMPNVDIDVCTDNNDDIRIRENPFIASPYVNSNISKDASFLSALQAELIILRDKENGSFKKHE